MGFPFRKSRIFSGTTRANNKKRHEEKAMNNYLQKNPPAEIQVPTIMDDLEKFGQAEKLLNQQGILPPKNPHPNERMQCAPRWDSVAEAAARGVELAEAMGEATGRNENMGDTASDAGFFALAFGTARFAKDSWNIQKCMNDQDAKYDREMDDYIKKIKTFADGMESHTTKTIKVDARDPRHPANRPFITTSYNNQREKRDWGLTFNTNGNTTGVGFKYKF
jgi:hypothetical protein